MLSPDASLRDVEISIIGNSSLQLCVNAMTSRSICGRSISVCNLYYHNTGKLTKVMQCLVLLLTQYGSVGLSWSYIYKNVSSKIEINTLQLVRRVENQTFSNCTLQILTYPFQSQIMTMLVTEYITSTTIHRISDVWMCVSIKIQHHDKHITVAGLSNSP